MRIEELQNGLPSQCQDPEIPFHSSFSLCSRQLSLSLSLLRCRFRRLLFSAVASSSIHLAEHGGSSGQRTPPREDDDDRNLSSTPKPSIRSRLPSAPWLQQRDAPETSTSHAPAEKKPTELEIGRGGSIERIVYRLRNLALDSEEEADTDGDGKKLPLRGKERLSKLLERSWSRPHSQQIADTARILLPWEREDNRGFLEEEDTKSAKRKRVKAPTLAELTIEDSTLRRLRRMGIILRERITVPKAGVTQAITEKIHDAWRQSEIVRLKFHEDLVHNMKTAHELVEGAQNTNNKLMAEELKALNGGTVLLQNKYYIVIYSGEDFIATSVATALSAKEELTKEIQDAEQQMLKSTVPLAELLKARARWGRNISTEDRNAMEEEASRYKTTKLFTEAKALKRVVASQRLEALSQHIIDLEKNIKVPKKVRVCTSISISFPLESSPFINTP